MNLIDELIAMIVDKKIELNNQDLKRKIEEIESSYNEAY